MVLEIINKLLAAHSIHEGADISQSPLMQKISDKIKENKKLTFILPAFPAKSPNLNKNMAISPDLGEVLALQNLDNICSKISQVYEPGAEVIICSDGKVFSDVVSVKDEEIEIYQDGIMEIISEFKLSRLKIFSLDNVFPRKNNDEKRNLLFKQYAKSLDEVRNLVLIEPTCKKLFNGLHRFLLEDALSMNFLKTKNQINKETKSRTYELLRRSDAWSSLLTEYFPNELRLSIHPYELKHEKFGIKLVTSSNKWATPWHNVTVKVSDKFELMHLKKAKELNVVKKFLKDKYAYFELASI